MKIYILDQKYKSLIRTMLRRERSNALAKAADVDLPETQVRRHTSHILSYIAVIFPLVVVRTSIEVFQKTRHPNPWERLTAQDWLCLHGM